jgi:hypothetical protein
MGAQLEQIESALQVSLNLSWSSVSGPRGAGQGSGASALIQPLRHYQPHQRPRDVTFRADTAASCYRVLPGMQLPGQIRG